MDGEDISKLKVAELKERLIERGLSASGVKADLVKRLSLANHAGAALPTSTNAEAAPVAEPAAVVESAPATQPLADGGTAVVEAPAAAASALPTILHITHFLRPFTLRQAKELFEEFGPLVPEPAGFAMDTIKTQCYVEYVNGADAAKAQAILHGMKWPPTHGKTLSVVCASKNLLADGSAALVPTVAAAAAVTTAVPETAGAGKTPVATRLTRPSLARARDSSDAALPPKSTVPALAPKAAIDDLFQKTKATPVIYFQPVPSVEVESKRAARAAAAAAAAAAAVAGKETGKETAKEPAKEAAAAPAPARRSPSPRRRSPSPAPATRRRTPSPPPRLID